MKKRNWLDLSRKLVDRYDLNYTLGGMSEILGLYALSFFGEGVLDTTVYPNPFPIVLNSGAFSLTVGNGIAYDPSGNFTEINDGPSAHNLVASSSFERWDLLVLRYKELGDTLIPKPSDPLTSVYLNLLDSYELATVQGTGPAYPAKGAHDIILSGLKIPANATLGTQCVVDLAIREIGRPDIVRFPDIIQEPMGGTIDNSNAIFSTTKKPLSGTLIVFIDGIVSSYSALDDTHFALTSAPDLGQTVNCFYVYESTSSTNPLAMTQEIPLGVTDGVNQLFALAGKTANKNATFVFLDGLLVPFSEWSLIQSPTGDQIKFEAIDTPKIGQKVHVAYFVNPKSEGSSPSGGGGSGGGGYVVTGSISSPVIVSAVGGIVVTSEQRQLQFVKAPASSGEMPVTANPQIANGSIVGQELVLKGTEDEVTGDYPVFDDLNGLDINGEWKATKNATIKLIWSGLNWFEESRR